MRVQLKFETSKFPTILIDSYRFSIRKIPGKSGFSSLTLSTTTEPISKAKRSWMDFRSSFSINSCLHFRCMAFIVLTDYIDPGQDPDIWVLKKSNWILRFTDDFWHTQLYFSYILLIMNFQKNIGFAMRKNHLDYVKNRQSCLGGSKIEKNCALGQSGRSPRYRNISMICHDFAWGEYYEACYEHTNMLIIPIR